MEERTMCVLFSLISHKYNIFFPCYLAITEQLSAMTFIVGGAIVERRKSYGSNHTQKNRGIFPFLVLSMEP
jgi:hypothetical protein